MLFIKSGKSAEEYLQTIKEEGGIEIYEFPKGNEENIDNYFRQLFDAGDLPSNKHKKSFNNPDARHIDTYDLFNNNCVTITKSGAKAGGINLDSESISPRGFNKDLSDQSQRDETVDVIYNPMDYLDSLLRMYYYAGFD